MSKMSKKNICLLVCVLIIVTIIAIIWLFTNNQNPVNSELSNIPKTTDPKNIPEEKNADMEFLKQYCNPENANNNIWECTGLYNYPGGPQEFEKDCLSIGYNFNCSGMCGSGKCYSFPSKNTACTDSSDCESMWCKPIDKNCKNNCTGRCSEVLPPDQCSSVEIFTFKAIENGFIVDKQAGGALCD